MLHPHATVPLMKLLEQVGINLEQVECRRVGQGRRFHEAEKKEQIVELRGLLTELSLVSDHGGATEDVGETAADKGPAHRPTITFIRAAMPPRSVSPTSCEMPPVPRMPGT